MDKSDLEHFTNNIQQQNSVMCTEMMLSHGKCEKNAKRALYELNDVVSTLNSNIKALDKNTFGHVLTKKEMMNNLFK